MQRVWGAAPCRTAPRNGPHGTGPEATSAPGIATVPGLRPGGRGFALSALAQAIDAAGGRCSRSLSVARHEKLVVLVGHRSYSVTPAHKVERMPTVNPRINVTLSPSLYGMVEALAKHQRVSRSMVLRELLEASEPALAQVVAMLKAAESLNDAAKNRMRQDLDQTISSVEKKAEQALALAAGVTFDLVAQAEAIRGRRPGRQMARKRSAGELVARSTDAVGSQQSPSRPPSSNRGVKSPDTTIKTIAKKVAAPRPKALKKGVFQ